MTAKEHNRLIGIFLMAHGGLQALIMLLLSVIYGIAGIAILIGERGPDRGIGLIFIAMVAFVVIFSLLFLVPQIIGGWKMFKEKPNAKKWGIVGSILASMSFPLGTAAGVYGLWFLFGELGNRFYTEKERPKFINEPNRVDEFQFNDYKQREPHSWR
jgi:hypothetical protein